MGGERWQRSVDELLTELRDTETVIRRAYSTMLELVAELDVRGAAPECGYRSVPELLKDVLRISRAEATRRARHAVAVTEVELTSGGSLPAPLPLTGAALREGVVAGEHLDVIARTLSNLPLHIGPEQREAAEHSLVDAARHIDPRTLATFAGQVRAYLDQDGPAPTDAELADPINELHLTTRRNGRVAFTGELEPETGALLRTVLSPLAKPRPSTETGPDPRTPAQRHGDAFVDLLHLAASTGGLPGEAGEKPHLVVTVPLDHLRIAAHATAHAAPPGLAANPTDPDIPTDPADPALPAERAERAEPAEPAEPADSIDPADPAFPTGPTDSADPTGPTEPADPVDPCDVGVPSGSLGFAATAELAAAPDRPVTTEVRSAAVLDGAGPLDAASARRMACDCKVIPAVLGSGSEVLDLGRASYTVNHAIRRALILRDKGCAFPTCDRPHQWCHAHHIEHWADGGPTRPDNLVLLCGQHHRLVHHSPWECFIHDGIPWFRPPRYVDPDQQPRTNPLHRPHHFALAGH